MTKTIIFICLLTAFFWQPTTLTARSPFPLETLYAQTDKQNYFTDENIWFRIYLLCSQTHVQTTSSRYIYAELINAEREVVNRVMIRHDENGVFAGHIPVTEDLEAGVYILRFFTRHLENFGEEYFFQRVIHIITPQWLRDENISDEYSVENEYSVEEDRDAPATNESFSVSFHPEGGDIPIGIETLIAFNAINSTGLGEPIQGAIFNERHDFITYIESAHLGIGSFEWIANSDEQFFAVVRNTAGVEKTFELPRARKDAISLQVFRYEGNIIVYLPQSKTDNRILYLSLQRRGISSSERWNNESEILVISEDELPTGIIGFILSDSQGTPLSKRQIFNINRAEIVNTTFTTENETHETRERVNATVTVTDNENRPLNANFSISVIDNDIARYDASVNILSTLLLTSELRGHIENPAYYFMAENENAKEHLDLVMLTHGWTRFDVNRIDEEETAAVWRDFERSLTITGTLGRNREMGGLFRSRRNPHPVSLMNFETGFFDVVYTTGDRRQLGDDRRRFRFENFEFSDGTGFIIAGSGFERTQIDIDEMEFPAVGHLFIPPKATISDEQRETMRRFMQEEEDLAWILELDEFVVTARARPLRRMQVSERRFARLPWQDIFRFLEFAFPHLRRDSCPITDQTVLVCFERPWMATVRQASMWSPLNQPLIVIDGIELPYTSYLFGLHPRHVKSLEMVERHSPNHCRTIFITTTDGRGAHIRNNAIITPLGYQITQEFFSPAYTTPEQRANEEIDLRRTVFWNPSVVTENGKAEIHFYTSDNVGNYVVVIEGITDEGKIVHLVSRLL